MCLLDTRRLARFVAVCCALCLAPGALAGSTVPMSLPTLADHAGQVIVGEVTKTRSYWADDPRRIETEIRFESVEYLKGRLADSDKTFTLVVPGGAVGPVTERIAHTPEFRSGEKWLLLILPTYKTYPIVGFSQGAFRIESDDEGVDRVYSAEGRPIAAISNAGFPVEPRPRPLDITKRLLAENRVRVRVHEERSDPVTAMSLARFRESMKPILDQSRDYELTVPAGKRMEADLKPVPLERSKARVQEGKS